MTTATQTTRPAPLPPTRVATPDGRRFPWGPVTAVHSIGRYAVVEYRRDASGFVQPEVWETHGETLFHTYIDGRSTSHSYRSLESALVGVIAYDRAGPNSQAALHFDLMTRGVLPSDTPATS